MNSLRKLAGLVALSALVLVALVLSARSASAQQSTAPTPAAKNYYYSFSTTVKPWAAVFEGLTKSPGLFLARNAEGNGCSAMNEGRGYANLAKFNTMPTTSAQGVTDGVRPLPVGTWMMLPIEADGFNLITVDYAAVSTKGCDGCHPMAYVGANAPATKDFTYATGVLATKWQQFTYRKAVTAKSEVYVAIGFSGSDASVGIDCVNISVEPLARPGVENNTK